MNPLFLPVLLGVQGMAMVLDEFYFHHRRGLGRWERIGHPLDTFTVILCFSWVCFIPYTYFASLVYLGLSLGSCLFVTKDEWVHVKECSPEEMWLHSILFVLHPAIFFVLGIEYGNHGFEGHQRSLLYVQLAILIMFMIYQCVYWNWFRLKTERAVQ